MNWRWPWDQSQFEKDATALLVAMKSCLIDMAKWQGKFNQQQQQLLTEVGKLMATLEEIKQEVTDQKAKIEALIAAFNDLKNNTNPGPGPGEVIVKQEDIDAIDAVIDETTAEIPAV